MTVNRFTPDICTDDNLLGKIFKIIFPGKTIDDFNTEELLGKHIGVSLVKKIKKSKTYLNVGNFLPLKTDDKKTTTPSLQSQDDIAKQLAIIIQNNPGLTKAMAKHLKNNQQSTSKEKGDHGVKKMSDAIEDLKKKKF